MRYTVDAGFIALADLTEALELYFEDEPAPAPHAALRRSRSAEACAPPRQLPGSSHVRAHDRGGSSRRGRRTTGARDAGAGVGGADPGRAGGGRGAVWGGLAGGVRVVG